MKSNADSRLAILARVRAAQIQAFIPETKKDLPKRIQYLKPSQEIKLARLQKEFEILGVENFVFTSDFELREKLKTLITEKICLSWNVEHLPYACGECLKGEKVFFGDDDRTQQGEADIGITSCEKVIAETGTVAVISAPGKPRTASLLPLIHIVIIRAQDIVMSMGEFFDQNYDQKLLPYLTFITGPSRTADIELSLTLGVHGPGKVIALIGP